MHPIKHTKPARGGFGYMKYNTYLFDFDGTLVDSMPSYVEVMLRILDEHKIEYSDDIIKTITPLGYSGTASYYVKELGVPMSEEEIVRIMNEYAYHEYAHRIQVKTGVVETLRALNSAGGGLYILTASPHTILDMCLRRLGIYDLFSGIWSCDDFSTTKTNPEIYKMAAERIGKPMCDILFLDDNYNATKTAAQAGMIVCGVYDDSSRDDIDEIKSVTHHYIMELGELLTL